MIVTLCIHANVFLSQMYDVYFFISGQPYNQLAILASSKGDHLTTIFYYCRSIAVKFPFPAASTNLQKALSKALEGYN